MKARFLFRESLILTHPGGSWLADNAKVDHAGMPVLPG
jgi:hypothetical protein